MGTSKPKYPKLYIGEWIATLGRKQVDIAKTADINEGYLSQLISGEKQNPSAHVLRRVASALGVPLQALDRPPPPPSAMQAIRSRLGASEMAALAAIWDTLKDSKKH